MAASVRAVRGGKANTFLGLLSAAAFSALAFAGNALAQEVEAQVPITVNVNANVIITPPAGTNKGTGDEGSVAANTQKTFNLKLVKDNAPVSYHPQKQARAGAWVSQSKGNVTLNLHPQQYQNAQISLHAVNGKRVLSGKASASKGTSSISRANIPAGVYMLSVKGTKGNSFTTKLIHNGDNLNINAAFAGDSRQLSKSAADGGDYGEWTITVSAAGYATQTLTFYPLAGPNSNRSFTLLAEDVKYTLTITRSPTAGGKVFVGNVESSGTTIHNAEAQVSVRAEAAEGYLFVGWTGPTLTSANKNATIAVNMRMDVALTANFEGITGTFTDARDKKIYKWVRIGDQKWMAENLNFSAHLSGDSRCYNNEPDSCAKYGRLYDWDAAMSACPAGWRLPDTADWNRLVTAAGGNNVAGSKLKSQTGWIDRNDGTSGNGTDDYGFSALPGGDRNIAGNFVGAGYAGFWWSATENGSGYAWYWGVGYHYDKTAVIDANKDYLWSARCLEDM